MTARSRGWLALLGAGCLGALLVVVWYVSFHSAEATYANVATVSRAQSLSGRDHLGAVAQFFTGLIQPSSYVFLALVPVLLGLFRRRPMIALVIVCVIAGANVTTELLKPILASRVPVGAPVNPGSFPSGHVTAATALVLSMVLAAPRWLRPPVALAGAVFVAAIAASVVMLAWHYPSDAAGGVLVASIWWLLGIAAVAFADSRGSRLPHGRVEVSRGALG